jgi:hypothetical protein
MESRPNQHRPTPDQRGVPEPGQQRPGNNKDRGYRRAGRRTRLRSSGRRERDERRVFELERRQEMFDAEVTTIYHMDMGERGESLHEPTIAEPAGDSAQNETDIQNPQSPITTQADRKAERADRKAAREKKEEQERREKRAKAEQFRETHKGTSLAKAHLEHDFDDSSRFIKLRRKGAKIAKSRPLFNPNPTTKG